MSITLFNHFSSGNILLFISVMMLIIGISMSFSKKERDRVRSRVTEELPERATLISAPNADLSARRRGYYTLVLGVILFIIWCWFFGLSSLAV